MEMRQREFDCLLSDQRLEPEERRDLLKHHSRGNVPNYVTYTLFGLLTVGSIVSTFYFKNNSADNSRAPSTQTSSTTQVEYRR